MNTDAIPQPQVLKNKPLVEAVFELRWELQGAQVPGVAVDPGYQLLLGSYFDRIKKDYPHVVPLPPATAPIEFTAHTVNYQFRVAKDSWPLTQIGPGILTVNDTDKYTWKDFQPRLDSAIRALFESYPDVGTELKPVWSQLRYINAIPFNQHATTATKLLREKLHTSVQFDSQLFQENPQEADSPIGFGMNVTFPLKTPRGVGGFIFAQGQRNDQTALIWEIVIRSVNDAAPQKPGDFQAWLEAAHDVAERWFLTLCRGELHNTFR